MKTRNRENPGDKQAGRKFKKNRARCRREPSPLVNPGLTLCEAGQLRLVIFAGQNGRGERCGIERPGRSAAAFLTRTGGGDQVPGGPQQGPVEHPQSLVIPGEDHQQSDGNGEKGRPGERDARVSKSVADPEDRRQKKEQGTKPGQRLKAEGEQTKSAGQRTERDAYPEGAARNRADYIAASPRPGHQQEEVE